MPFFGNRTFGVGKQSPVARLVGFRNIFAAHLMV